MRWPCITLTLPLVLAACGGSGPVPTSVAINAPPPAPPVIAATIPTTPAESSLVTQCQRLFAEAMAGRAVNYSSPAIASAGGSTTINLAAVPAGAPAGPAMEYNCTYSGTALTAAGLV